MGSSTRPRGLGLVVGVQLLAVALVVGWFATGHASAPDHGLQQIDLLMLDERVPGVEPVGDRATMVVAAGQCPLPPPRDVEVLDEVGERYPVVVTTDPDLARRLALPRAATGCEPGYVLVSPDGRVRYRTYDPGWPDHGFEQSVLLGAIEDEHGEHAR